MNKAQQEAGNSTEFPVSSARRELKRIEEEIDSLNSAIKEAEIKEEKNHYIDLRNIATAKKEGILHGLEAVFDELKSKNVNCVGMSKDFIKGSNWCNGLWKNHIRELESKLLGEKG